jgi:ribulose-phosphate 3-epimerase
MGLIVSSYTMSKRKISPSLMCTSFLNLREELDLFIKHRIDYLHIDIMDGHYVANFSLGADFCKAVAAYSSIPLDIHLMIEDPDRYVDSFSRFEGAVVSFHPETSCQPLRTIGEIKRRGRRAGISLSPSVSLGSVEKLLPWVDLVCVMTVHPGYAGQRLVHGAIEKLAEVADLIKAKGYNVEVEVDGNVSWDNLPKMISAGAGVFVAGTSSIFQPGTDMQRNIERFRSIIDRTIIDHDNLRL